MRVWSLAMHAKFDTSKYRARMRLYNNNIIQTQQQFI